MFKKKHSLLKIIESVQPTAPLRDQVQWIKNLLEWLRLPVTPHGEVEEGSAQTVRLKLLMKTLREYPAFKKDVSASIEAILKQVDPLDLFSDAGMVESHAFLRELLVRIALHYLPIYRDFTKLSVIFEDIFEDDDAEWIAGIDPGVLTEFVKELEFNSVFTEEFTKKLKYAVGQARKILLARLASLSSIPGFRDRVPSHERFLLVEISHEDSKEMLQQAFRVIVDVYKSLDQTGVSIELVFLLERMKAILFRLQLLHDVEVQVVDATIVKSVMSAILESQYERNSIKGFLSSNLSLISKKIVDRAGVTGEHYIARTRKESRQLFWSAGGGGILTVGTTLLKSAITNLKLPLFVEGMFAWFNYSMSFMFLQIAHFTLATKMPAMTASVLAAELRGVRDFEMLQDFVEETVHVVRSGFLAALGNVVFVILGASVLDFVIFHYWGHHLYTSEKATHYFEAHHPWMSLTIWYASYTGIVLWFANAIGGWFENWYVYRRLPQWLEESTKLKKAFGQKGSSKVSTWISAGIMGIATNIALGFMLAFSTVVGKFFGIPVDVRHVTLSSGTLALSFAGMEELNLSLILPSFFAIAIIGSLNFGVSFVISLIVAAQARGIKLSQYHHLFRLIGRRFLNRPRDFFIHP